MNTRSRNERGGQAVRLVRHQLHPAAPPAPVGLRVGCYFRFSSAGQNETSIERQEEVCHLYAKKIGANSIKDYVDRAKTGTSIKNRIALKELLNDIEAGVIDVVIVEHIDRISRDEADLHHINKFYIKRFKCQLHTCRSGHLSGLALSLDGGMSAEQREIMLMRMEKGLRAAAKQGFSNSRVRYGYQKSASRPGIRLIHPERAGHVRSMFETSAAGTSTTEIADAMNTLSPTPGDCTLLDAGVELKERARWTPQMVIAILRSSTYRGIMTYGALETQRDFDSKKVIGYLERPVDEWIVVHNENIRIVDDDLAEQVRQRLDLAYDGNRTGKAPHRYLFGKKLACGVCGGNIRTHRQNGHVQYWCQDEACRRCGKPRIAWLERAVLEELVVLVADSVTVDNYMKSLEAELTAISSLNAEQVEILEKRRDELSALVDQTLTPNAIPNVRPERLKAIRTQLLVQIADVDAKIAEFVAIPETVPTEIDVTFKDGVAQMLAQLPFRADDPVSIALADQVRRMVRVVKIGPTASAKAPIPITVEFVLGSAMSSSTAEEAVVIRREVVIDVEACTRMEIDAARTRREDAIIDEYERFLADAPAEAWTCAQAAIGRGLDTLPALGWEPAMLVKLAAFMCASTTGPDDTPCHLGAPDKLRDALGILVASGSWSRLIEAWRKSTPEFLAGARLDLMDFWSRSARRRLGTRAGAHEREAALQRQAAALRDPACSMRLSAVAMLMGGRKRDDVKAATSLSRSAFKAWSTICRLMDPDRIVDALQARDGDMSAWQSEVARVAQSGRGLRDLARRAPCIDLSTRIEALSMLVDGASISGTAHLTGIDEKFVTRLFRMSIDDALALIGTYRWRPRTARLQAREPFAEQAGKLLSLCDGIPGEGERTPLKAVAGHLLGESVRKIARDLALTSQDVAAYVDVYHYLGPAGLLTAALRQGIHDVADLPSANEDIRRKLEDLERSSNEEQDEAVANRIRAVAMNLRGEDAKSIFQATGVWKNSVKALVRAYTLGGLPALVGQRYPERLTAEQIEELRAAVASGVDPLDPTLQVTRPGLMKFCEVRFGVKYVIQTFSDLLRRLDIRLDERQRVHLSKVGHRSATISQLEFGP